MIPAHCSVSLPGTRPCLHRSHQGGRFTLIKDSCPHPYSIRGHHHIHCETSIHISERHHWTTTTFTLSNCNIRPVNALVIGSCSILLQFMNMAEHAYEVHGNKVAFYYMVSPIMWLNFLAQNCGPHGTYDPCSVLTFYHYRASCLLWQLLLCRIKW